MTDWVDPDRREAGMNRLLARMAELPLLDEADIDIYARGGHRRDLTRAELQVLRAAAVGMDAHATADIYGIAFETVRMHRRRAILKLRAKNTCHAVALALRAGLIG